LPRTADWREKDGEEKARFKERRVADSKRGGGKLGASETRRRGRMSNPNRVKAARIPKSKLKETHRKKSWPQRRDGGHAKKKKRRGEKKTLAWEPSKQRKRGSDTQTGRKKKKIVVGGKNLGEKERMYGNLWASSFLPKKPGRRPAKQQRVGDTQKSPYQEGEETNEQKCQRK